MDGRGDRRLGVSIVYAHLGVKGRTLQPHLSAHAFHLGAEVQGMRGTGVRKGRESQLATGQETEVG